MEAAGATVVLDGATAAEAVAARRLPHEGTAEEDEYEHAGFTAADEVSTSVRVASEQVLGEPASRNGVLGKACDAFPPAYLLTC